MVDERRSVPAAPVLCVAFNRPDLFEQVIRAIRISRPREVYVAIDGPRTGHRKDVELCRQVRKVAEEIDWAPSVI